jgi:hypothetical protein
MTEFMHNYGETYWEDQRSDSGLFGGIALLAMLVCIINCALPQVEMLLTGGSVPIPIAAIKITCFGVLIAMMLMYGRLDLSAFPTRMWIFAMAYLVLVFPFLCFWQDKPPDELLLGYNAYYCPLIFAPAACAFRGKVPERLGIRILLWAFAACALLGWTQFILQNPIVQLASNDGNFRIVASIWAQPGTDETIRATSFFGTALEYGNLAVLVAAMGIGMCGKPDGWKLGIPLYLFAAATCYTTLTRMVFLELGVATIAALTFTFGRSLRRMTWQPLIALGLGWLIALGGLAQLIGQTSGLYETRSLSDSGSLEVRLQQWELYGSELAHSSVGQQLFGYGFCQVAKPLIIANKDIGKANVFVDNLYLALTLHIGFVGMLVIVALLWAMWRCLRSETIQRPTPLLIGISSFWATFLIAGIFNVQPANFGFWFLVAMIVSRPANEAAGELNERSHWPGTAEPSVELS